MSVDQAAQEIEDGFESLRAVLGPKAVAPFFRIPGLLRQSSVEQYLASRNVMTWSVDFLADDWTHISASEIAKRTISRMESHRKGILLLHDIQPATALAFPEILQELKARGYKIVHVVPATPDRPKTVTAPEQWVARNPPAEVKVWPRVVSTEVKDEEPALEVPSPRNFGLSGSPEAPVKVELVRSYERPPVREGEIPLPPVTPWPRQMYTVPIAEDDALPIAGAHNFRYARVFQMPNSERRKSATQTAASKPKDSHQPATTGSAPAHQEASAAPRRSLFSGIRGPLQIFPSLRD
jgi:peptidoglycan-N-acetylglucosamine deacetylase